MSSAQEHLVLGPELAGALLTPEEFDAADDGNELYVYELINGVLVVTPPPSEEERGSNELLGQLLRNYRDLHPQGRAGLGRVPDFRRDPQAIVIEHVSRGRRTGSVTTRRSVRSISSPASPSTGSSTASSDE